jgi:hypothetical protein
MEPNRPVSINSIISSEKTIEIPIKPMKAPVTVLNRGYSLKNIALFNMFMEIIVEKITAIRPVFNPEPAAL